jgi:steroid delta-isomerase-like uncharacterized protein
MNSNRDVFTRWIEIVNSHDMTDTSDVWDTNGVIHGTSAHEDAHGLQDIASRFEPALTAFPDFHIEVHDVVAAGDRIAARYKCTGTHTSDFIGIPATGVQIEMAALAIYRFANGKIAEAWSIDDDLPVIQKLEQATTNATT